MKQQEKTWAIFCHLGGLVGFIIPFGNILAPLIIWLLKKEESPEIDKHGKEALNFQISTTIYNIISLLLVLVIIGFPLMIILLVAEIILIIKAAIAASNGQFYKYPLTLRLIK